MLSYSRDGRTYERADIADYSVSEHHFEARHDAEPDLPRLRHGAKR
jgi:hypothetical protein